MKFSHVVPLATLGAAFVVPNEQILAQLAPNGNEEDRSWFEQVVDEAVDVSEEVASRFHDWPYWPGALSFVGEERTSSVQAFDQAIENDGQGADSLEDFGEEYEFLQEEAFLSHDIWEVIADDEPHHGPPHHGPPRDGPPHHGPPHGKPGHDKPHHPPHHHEPNQTIYQLISESKYTTQLAKYISKYDDLVEALNSTKANFTLFAPIDAAFEKIPEKQREPTKEEIKAILSYHVVPDVYDAKRVLLSNTAPTLLKGDHLSSKPEPQRLAFKLGLRGPTVNFYSRIVAVNIFATNGVIHGVSSIIVPPPNAISIVDLLPSEFSTLELGLTKTGLLEKLNTTDHAGGTLFAPSNFAFRKLGPRINAFLFSKYGAKYLKALLEYHVVPDVTLYSDAYYKASDDDGEKAKANAEIPSGKFHIDLPTLLKDRTLSVDLFHLRAFTSIHINGFSRVTVSDGVAQDGVIHGVSDVLIPPKQLGGAGGFAEEWYGEEMSVDELKARLEPYLNKQHKSDL